MRLKGLSIASLLVILASTARRVEAQTSPSVPTQTAAESRVRAVVEAHNAERRAAGLRSLRVSAKLEAAARAHALDMARRGTMSHTGGDGTSALDRIKRAGYRYRRAGENIARGKFTTAKLMAGWMDSPPHRLNILGSYTEIGAAFATDDRGRAYWCIDFGLPRAP